jgi:hypothetical protein
MKEATRYSFILFLLCIFASGCSNLRTTDPKQTATEQYLLNQAAQRSVEQLVTNPVRDRLIYVDTTWVIGDKYPREENLYLVGELRARLLEGGARLTSDRSEAQVILEVRSLGVGIDRLDSLVGLPSLSLPAGGNVPVVTPEIAIIKRLRQRGYASIAYVAYWRDSGEIVASSGPFLGKTERDDFWILGFGPRTWGTIPPAKE